MFGPRPLFNTSFICICYTDVLCFFYILSFLSYIVQDNRVQVNLGKANTLLAYVIVYVCVYACVCACVHLCRLIARCFPAVRSSVITVQTPPPSAAETLSLWSLFSSLFGGSLTLCLSLLLNLTLLTHRTIILFQSAHSISHLLSLKGYLVSLFPVCISLGSV